MHSRTRPPFRAALLFTLLAHAAATLLWEDLTLRPRDIVVLPSFGDGEKHITVLNKPRPGTDAPVISDSPLYTAGPPSISEGPNGYTNYTYTLALTGAVGAEPFTVTVSNREALTGTFIAAGFVIKEDGVIVSGDDGEGVTVGQEGSTNYEVVAVGVDGSSVDISTTSIMARPSSGSVYMEELDRDGTSLSNSRFTLAISKFRVGSGSFVLSFDTPTIEYRGETFETVLHVTQMTSPTPPCVVEGSELVSRSGTVEATMFNLLTPPRDSPVTAIVLTVGDSSYPFNSKASSLVLPTSTVIFSKVSAVGAAKITCDGEDAVVLENGKVISAGLTISGDGNSGTGSEPLAKDTLVQEFPISATESLLTSVIRVVDSDPSLLTQAQGQAILDEYSSTVSAPNCVIANITVGSARVLLGGLVSDVSESKESLKTAFSDCSFQTNTGYACNKLELGEVQVVNANAAVAAAGTAGIATWTIILISCVGAFALVAVVVLTLWGVHRRSSQMSESGYSSSGPLGVPDPSDLLYEQSIVRDIYGRGEDGGPSQAAAEDSARIAEMREDLPRPPSSGSGLSRGRATSVDASSTYSV